MIINCICGLKKFKVDDDEIPSEGRKLKCGACSQVWFYDPSNPDASVPLDEQQENQTQTPSPNIPVGDVPQNVEETISPRLTIWYFSSLIYIVMIMIFVKLIMST